MDKRIKIIHRDDVAPLYFRDGEIESRRLVTRKKDGCEAMSFHVNVIQGGRRRTDDVVYPDMDEINYMVSGKGTLIYDGGRHPVAEGSVWYVPAGRRYGLENEGVAVVISVFSPPRE